jgi:LysM repeat protein
MPTTASNTDNYTVQSGDSLSAIAAQNGTDWQTLYALNQDHLRSGNPDVIYAGEQLILPPKNNGTNSTVPRTLPADSAPQAAGNNYTTETQDGTIIVTRANGTPPGDPSEVEVSHDYINSTINTATSKPATDAISGDVAEVMLSFQNIQQSQKKLDGVTNQNALMVSKAQCKT